MRPAAPALAAALWLAGGAASAAEPSRVSVEVLKEQLGRFDDRRVRVRGVLDECNGVVCHICPNWQARDVRDQCLELGDWKRGQSRRLDERFRYSEVVLTAVAHDRSRAALDPHAGLMHCVGSRDCNGELLNVEVEAVLERRAATDTQVLSNAKQPLLEPSAREDQVMREAFTSQLTPPHQMLVLRARRSKTFLDQERDGFTWGWLCVEKPSNRRSLTWPTNQGQLYASPVTPYVCFQAGNLKGRGWEVLTDTRSELRPDRRSPVVS